MAIGPGASVLIPIIRSALIVPIVSALITGAAAQQPPMAPPVTVAKPVVKDIVEWDEFTGRFDAVGAVEIRARVGGYLESVQFKDGALVAKSGTLVATPVGGTHFVEPGYDTAIEKTLRKHWKDHAAINFDNVAITHDELCSCCNGGRLLPAECFEGGA